jgi:zinc protease
MPNFSLRGLFALGLVLLLTGLLVGPERSANARVFDPEIFTLDNGLKVIVVTNRRAPIVTHMIWYNVGAADEAPGESGLAHFLEHLMFKGTEKLGPGEFSKIVALNGGRENAFTSWDFTGYFQTVASDRLEIVMEHEADRMTNLVLSDEVVLPERQVVREERRSRVDNAPSAQLGEMIRASLYLNHPYRIPIIGWDHEISALNTEAALAFYRRWYAPNNAVLVVAGDVDAADVRPLAEKYYGPIAAKPVPERTRATEPPQNAARRVILESPQVNQPSLSISYLAPSYRTGKNGEAYALEVLSEILGGGATSRLYSSLVVTQGIAASAGAGYSGDSYDMTSFQFYASPRPGTEMAEVEEALRAEIGLVLRDGVSDEEVAAAKKRLRASAIYARDSLGAAPNIIGRALTSGRSLEELEGWPDRIGEVTVEAVNAAARAVFIDESSVSGLLLPKPSS